jgi:tripartite-type tricarboxylate transporter receptor subunit TctC
LPDVPSLDELGYKGFDMTSWLCVVAPAGLPAEVRATLNKAIIAMMANKDTQEKLLGAGFEPELLLIDNWAAWVNAEVEKMRIIAKKSNIIAE